MSTRAIPTRLALPSHFCPAPTNLCENYSSAPSGLVRFSTFVPRLALYSFAALRLWLGLGLERVYFAVAAAALPGDIAAFASLMPD